MSEFNELKPRLKSPKNRFQLSAGLNLEFNTTLMEPTIFELRLKSKPRLKFFKFGLCNDTGRKNFNGSYSSPSVFTNTNVSPEIIKICVFMWTLDNHGVLPDIQLLLNCKMKGIVSVISSDHPCKDRNARFRTEP